MKAAAQDAQALCAILLAICTLGGQRCFWLVLLLQLIEGTEATLMTVLAFVHLLVGLRGLHANYCMCGYLVKMPPLSVWTYDAVHFMST